MPTKTTALSVRVSDDDAEFLAQLRLDGATTPSEKLRALLSAQRRLQDGARHPAEAAESIEDLLRPALRRLRRAETELGIHSEALQRLYDRLPLLTGLAMAGPNLNEDVPGAKTLADFEKKMLGHAALLCEELLNLLLISIPHAYEPDTVREHLTPLVELADVAQLRNTHTEGEK